MIAIAISIVEGNIELDKVQSCSEKTELARQARCKAMELKRTAYAFAPPPPPTPPVQCKVQNVNQPWSSYRPSSPDYNLRHRLHCCLQCYAVRFRAVQSITAADQMTTKIIGWAMCEEEVVVMGIVAVQLEKLEELPLQTFDELFVEEWWDKDEAENLKTPQTNFEQNVHHQIDRQNTQIGQIEPNSTDLLGQIEPNSTDQNAPLTESDHSDNAKNGEENIAEDERKRKIIDKFHEIKDEFKQKEKYSNLAKPHQTINTPKANKRN
uniref:Uncharacterized protein n=1 Tax=Globodera rostochiensis TaxID=31243 RepID=A0A914HAB0_GLORO